MPDDVPSAKPPANIDRAAVDRVLSRALELQTSRTGDPQDALTEAQLLDIARDVGLDPSNLRQALAEERVRVAVPDERGLLAALYGGAFASAQRSVRGTPAQVLRSLDEWMQQRECLTVQRYLSSESIVWEARRDVVGLVKRAVSGRGQALGRATEVSATVMAVDADRVLVRLDARLIGYRALMVQQSAALTVIGLMGGWILSILAFPIVASAVPVVLLAPGGFAAGRASHLQTVRRAQISLEQVLDRLERGEAGRPPSLLSMLAAAAGRRG